MTKLTTRLLGLTPKIGLIPVAALLLYGCDTPERLPSDLSIDTSQEVLREKVIAPIKGLDEDELAVFEPLPRRKLLQVRHGSSSLSDRRFIATLEEMLGAESVFENGTDGGNEADEPAEAPKLSDAQKQEILERRGFERTQLLVNKGLEFETELLNALRTLDGEIESLTGNTVGGLGLNVQSFGRNLTAQQDGYLAMPADLIFVGGENGTFSSKTAVIKQMMDNPEITFSVRQMPLPDALDFLFQTIGLQAAMSDAVIAKDVTVSLSVQASAMAILDALLEQHNIAIVYDPMLEVAQIYTQDQFTARIGAVRTAIGQYNAIVKAKIDLAKAESDRDRVAELLQYAQLLLGGDDRGFIRGIESLSRAPADEATSTLITTMTRNALELREEMIGFDEVTANQLAGKANALGGSSDLAGGFGAILSEDACIWPKQEIFTEKVAVYNAEIGGTNDTPGVVGKVNDFFTRIRPDNAADNTSQPLDATFKIPSYCGTDNPAPKKPIILPDDTGITVIGTREDNNLVVRLIEQYDVPELQVLIEIFIITVSRDFSRQIDSFLSARPSGGGNGVQEATLEQLGTAVTTAGTFNLGLTSPNTELSNIINFLESNKLGRVVSSPTILVGDKRTATIERVLEAKVPGPDVLNSDNQTVDGPPVPYRAPFKLEIKEVDINRLNNTVRLHVVLDDTRFEDALASVNELSDTTSDKITTTFFASPGDVVVLAGLTRNEETTNTSGLPGTTGSLAPVAPLVGGADSVTTAMKETIIFMAPTVIDPSADNQPHSAFRKRARNTQ